MKTYLKIPVEGKPEPVVIEDGIDELSILQDAVGGKIEGVGISQGHTIYVNEEGLLDQLPHNQFASVVANTYLVGDAIMVGPVDDEGETESVFPSIVETLTSY